MNEIAWRYSGRWNLGFYIRRWTRRWRHLSYDGRAFGGTHKILEVGPYTLCVWWR